MLRVSVCISVAGAVQRRRGGAAGAGGGSVGALGVALSQLLGREEGLGGLVFHLYGKFDGIWNTIPAYSSVSFQFISAASKAPFSFPPKQRPVSLRLSLSLNGVLLPCIQGLGSLSLPFPPPPLPACDPTLRPHPSSLCQSGAAQPCRGAGAAGDPTPAAGGRAGRRRRGAAAAEPRAKFTVIFYCVQPAARLCLHPCTYIY